MLRGRTVVPGHCGVPVPSTGAQRGGVRVCVCGGGGAYDILYQSAYMYKVYKVLIS